MGGNSNGEHERRTSPSPVNDIERTPEEKQKFYHIETSEQRSARSRLTHLRQIGAGIKRWWQHR